MTTDELWAAVSKECPLRIAVAPHQHGHFTHWVDGDHVRCINIQNDIPDCCESPTAAQAAAWQGDVKELS